MYVTECHTTCYCCSCIVIVVSVVECLTYSDHIIVAIMISMDLMLLPESVSFPTQLDNCRSVFSFRMFHLIALIVYLLLFTTNILHSSTHTHTHTLTHSHLLTSLRIFCKYFFCRFCFPPFFLNLHYFYPIFFPSLDLHIPFPSCYP